MKMKYMGYTTREIEVRNMTIGDMFVSLAETLIENNATEDVEIRFFETDSAEFTKFDNMGKMLTSGWNTTWKINVLDRKAFEDTDTKNLNTSLLCLKAQKKMKSKSKRRVTSRKAR